MRRVKAHGRRGPERLRDVTQTEGHTGPVTATGTHAGRTVRAPSLVSAPPAQVRVGLPEAADKDGLRGDRLRSPAGDGFAEAAAVKKGIASRPEPTGPVQAGCPLPRPRRQARRRSRARRLWRRWHRPTRTSAVVDVRVIADGNRLWLPPVTARALATVLAEVIQVR